jgi:hypothetical protein
LGCLDETLKSLIIPGPIWLFQLWLSATFGSDLDAFLPKDFEGAHKPRSTKGIGLAMLRYRESKTNQIQFSEAFNVFLNCHVFTPSLASFLKRTCGPEWFLKKFPTQDAEHAGETNAIWRSYLTPMMISNRATPNT